VVEPNIATKGVFVETAICIGPESVVTKSLAPLIKEISSTALSSPVLSTYSPLDLKYRYLSLQVLYQNSLVFQPDMGILARSLYICLQKE